MAQRMFSPPTMAKAADAWEARSLRSILGPRSERNRPDLPLLSVARERGVFVRSADDANHNAIPEDLTNYKIARKGDLVVNKMKAWQGSLGLAPVDGIVSPAYFVFEADFAVPRYGEYLLRSKPYVAKFGAASDGVRIGQWDLNIPRMRDIEVYLPPAEEQAAIVKYLAHANARIDKAIAAKHRLIALLEEQIATRIGAAFERSDDRDSHRLRAFTGRPITGITPPTTESRYFENGTVDWHGPSSFSADLFLGVAARKVADAAIDEGAVRLLRSPSLLVVAIGATCGKSAIVLESTCTNQQVVAFSLDLARCDPEFIGYQAKALERKWRGSASTATIPMISTEVLRSSPFWLPSLEEQREIAGLISEQRTKKSNAVRRINREITLLREFRTRLVADVVTGQVDVRALAATLPEAPELFDNTASATDDDLEEALSEGEE